MGQQTGFPDFLYPDSVVEQIKTMKLTEKEQKQLGLEELYSELPYAYVKEVGVFEALGIAASLKRNLINSKIRNFVVKQIIINPDKLFDPADLSMAQHLMLCGFITKRGSLPNEDSYDVEYKDSWQQFVTTAVTNIQRIDNSTGRLKIAVKTHANKIEDKILDYEDFEKNPFFVIKEDDTESKNTVVPSKERALYAYVSDRGRKLFDWYQQATLDWYQQAFSNR